MLFNNIINKIINFQEGEADRVSEVEVEEVVGLALEGEVETKEEDGDAKNPFFKIFITFILCFSILIFKFNSVFFISINSVRYILVEFFFNHGRSEWFSNFLSLKNCGC